MYYLREAGKPQAGTSSCDACPKTNKQKPKIRITSFWFKSNSIQLYFSLR